MILSYTAVTLNYIVEYVPISPQRYMHGFVCPKQKPLGCSLTNGPEGASNASLFSLVSDKSIASHSAFKPQAYEMNLLQKMMVSETCFVARSEERV